MKQPERQQEPSGAEIGQLVLVGTAVAQGLLVGGWLALFPYVALRVGGFPPAPAFFVRWAGVLHLALAAGYVLEHLRFRRVTLLAVAKGATALFLVAAWILDGLPALMVVALFLEGGLALAAALVQGPADRSRRTRARLRLVTPSPSQVRPVGRG
ncbi:MAG: hypothetical protein ACJ79E_21910 [Anaeromyxobacteraceae bacterium]